MKSVSLGTYLTTFCNRKTHVNDSFIENTNIYLNKSFSFNPLVVDKLSIDFSGSFIAYSTIFQKAGKSGILNNVLWFTGDG